MRTVRRQKEYEQPALLPNGPTLFDGLLMNAGIIQNHDRQARQRQRKGI